MEYQEKLQEEAKKKFIAWLSHSNFYIEKNESTQSNSMPRFVVFDKNDFFTPLYYADTLDDILNNESIISKLEDRGCDIGALEEAAKIIKIDDVTRLGVGRYYDEFAIDWSGVTDETFNRNIKEALTKVRRLPTHVLDLPMTKNELSTDEYRTSLWITSADKEDNSYEITMYLHDQFNDKIPIHGDFYELGIFGDNDIEKDGFKAIQEYINDKVKSAFDINNVIEFGDFYDFADNAKIIDTLLDEPDLFVKSDNENARRWAATKGIALEQLINDGDPEVRAEVAKQGYGLNRLINDKDEYVRDAVAYKGYGLDVLMYDENPIVRLAVAEVANELGYTDIIQKLIDDSNKDVKLTADSQYRKLSGRRTKFLGELDGTKYVLVHGSLNDSTLIHINKEFGDQKLVIAATSNTLSDVFSRKLENNDNIKIITIGKELPFELYYNSGKYTDAALINKIHEAYIDRTTPVTMYGYEEAKALGLTEQWKNNIFANGRCSKAIVEAIDAHSYPYSDIGGQKIDIDKAINEVLGKFPAERVANVIAHTTFPSLDLLTEYTYKTRNFDPRISQSVREWAKDHILCQENWDIRHFNQCESIIDKTHAVIFDSLAKGFIQKYNELQKETEKKPQQQKKKSSVDRNL